MNDEPSSDPRSDATRPLDVHDLATAPPALVAARVAAVSTAGAAAIHLAVTGEHAAEWWAFGAFFLAVAVVQGALALATWSPRPALRVPWARLVAAAAVVDGLTLLLWLVTRTTGLPVGPTPGAAEPVGLADVVCAVLEAAAVLAAVVALRWRAGAQSSPAARVARHAGAVVAATVAAVLVASGVAVAAPGEHEHADAAAHDAGHDAAHGTAHGTAHGNGERHDLADLPDVSAATAEQTAAARRLLTTLVSDTARYRDPDVAARAGYDVDQALARWKKRHPGKPLAAVPALHVPAQPARADGRLLDPSAPETLIYHRSAQGDLTLEGVMFTAEQQQPPSSYAPYLRWHFHATCVGPDGARTTPDDGHDTSSCPTGTKARTSGYMTHVWFVPPDDLVHAFALAPPKAALRAALAPSSTG